jgi:hypothetical protein
MDKKEEEAVEKHISLLEAENEELEKEVSKEEKKKALHEIRSSYGKDWKKTIWGAVKSLKINKENLQTLHSLGSNPELKSLNDPRSFSGRKDVFRE